ERRDVGLEAPHDRARLRAAALVGLLELDVLPGLLLPLLLEARDDGLAVELARRRVAAEHERDRLRVRPARRAASLAARERDDGGDENGRCDRERSASWHHSVLPNSQRLNRILVPR